MIEDKELRQLFEVESNEHLNVLEAGLLQLEENPLDKSALEEVFREAHSLKGAARMLGLSDIELLAHRLEDLLGTAHRSGNQLESASIESLLQGVDVLRRLSAEALGGEATHTDIIAIMEQLGKPLSNHTVTEGELPVQEKLSQPQGKEEKLTPPPAMEEEQDLQRVKTTEVIEAQTEPDAVTTTEEEDSPYQISTIRVSTDRLDALMTHAGELAVTRLRIARRLVDLEAFLSLWDEWNNEVSYQTLAANNTVALKRFAKKSEKEIATRERHYLERIGDSLTRIIEASYQDTTHLDSVSNELEESVRTIRLLPLSSVFSLFARSVRDLAKQQEKEVELIIEGGETKADKRILEEIKDPLMHMIRNAIDHGIESPDERERVGKPRRGIIRLKAYQLEGHIMIDVVDDGRGLDLESIGQAAARRKIISESELASMTPDQVQQVVFVSGVSTSGIITDVSGRGIGLDVVKKNVEQLKGTIRLTSQPGHGCTLSLRLPITLATMAVLIVSERGHYYAIPIEYIQSLRKISPADIFPVDARDAILYNDKPTSIIQLAEILELPGRPQTETGSDTSTDSALTCVILTVGNEQTGILVEELINEQEVVLKQHSKILKRVRNISGSTILGTGEICTVLNPHDMVKSVQKMSGSSSIGKAAAVPQSVTKTLLLVEDSIIARTQEKRILEAAGYEVIIAVDGMDAFSKLNELKVDAVVSDIQMPNLNGLELTEKIRADKKYQDIPIILVTALASDEDKKRGLEVGADAYIGKPSFDQKILLDTLRRLVV